MTTTDHGVPSRALSGASLLGAGVVALGAAAVFALIARRVATGAAQPGDRAVRDAVQSHRSAALDVAVKPVTLLSLPVLVVTGTAALVWHLHQTGRRAAAVAIGVTPLIAGTAGQAFTTFLHQRNPPDSRDAPYGEVTEPSFPSGHTTGVTAEAIAIGFVMANEGLAPPELLAALLAWPLLVGTTRVYRDRHWMSDILGGWAAGVSVAALGVAVYGSLADDARE
jgi:undecaprenyl-diphosphatase